ncbi:transcriptional regulator [Clostridium beijerinckii]|nr:transcriptional regulator [Clostridium beijerinckii]
MNEKVLEFTIFCVESLSERLNISAKRVYNMLKNDTNILEYYIIPCYEPLHTQSKSYIIDDLITVLKEKGVVV